MNKFIFKMLPFKLTCIIVLIVINLSSVYGFNFSNSFNYNNSYFFLGGSMIIFVATAISLGFCYSICHSRKNENENENLTSTTQLKDFKTESEKFTRVTNSTTSYSPELVIPSRSKILDEFTSEPPLPTYWQTIELGGELRTPNTLYPADHLSISKV